MCGCVLMCYLAREEEKKEVREEKRESDRAQHGSPQMVIV